MYRSVQFCGARKSGGKGLEESIGMWVLFIIQDKGMGRSLTSCKSATTQFKTKKTNSHINRTLFVSHKHDNSSHNPLVSVISTCACDGVERGSDGEGDASFVSHQTDSTERRSRTRAADLWGTHVTRLSYPQTFDQSEVTHKQFRPDKWQMVVMQTVVRKYNYCTCSHGWYLQKKLLISTPVSNPAMFNLFICHFIFHTYFSDISVLGPNNEGR